MKSHFLKFALFSFLAVSMSACNNDDEVAPEDEEPVVAFAFDAQNPPIEVPSALQSSTNENAIAINGILASANVLSSYGAYFDIPEGADFSTTPISTSNSRVASSGNVRVYTWTYSDANGTYTTAYQTSEDANDYIFEIFFNFGDGFTKLLEGRESKNDLKQGSLKWFDFSGGDTYLTYEWEEFANGDFEFNFITFSFRYEILVNADGSGAISSFTDNVINASYTWNAGGTAGTYTSYDSEGNISDTFDWNS